MESYEQHDNSQLRKEVAELKSQKTEILKALRPFTTTPIRLSLLDRLTSLLGVSVAADIFMEAKLTHEKYINDDCDETRYTSGMHELRFALEEVNQENKRLFRTVGDLIDILSPFVDQVEDKDRLAEVLKTFMNKRSDK